eukprot:jgi/Psemu1/302160/fgenesh1_kg.59_\
MSPAETKKVRHKNNLSHAFFSQKIAASYEVHTKYLYVFRFLVPGTRNNEYLRKCKIYQ